MIDDELYIRLEDGSYKNSEYKTPPEFIGIKATRVIEFANFISPEIGRYFRDFIEINDKTVLSEDACGRVTNCVMNKEYGLIRL